MIRYLNVTNNGLQVEVSPSQKTLGRADIPKLSIEANIRAAVLDYFEQSGFIEWRNMASFNGGEDYKWGLTEKGFQKVFGGSVYGCA
jgi:hypothetical protein